MLGQLFLLRSARASLIFFNGLFRDFSSLRHMAHARAGLGSSLGQVGQLGARTCRFKGWPEITSATAKRNPFPQLIGPSSFSSKKKQQKRRNFQRHTWEKLNYDFNLQEKKWFVPKRITALSTLESWRYRFVSTFIRFRLFDLKNEMKTAIFPPPQMRFVSLLFCRSLATFQATELSRHKCFLLVFGGRGISLGFTEFYGILREKRVLLHFSIVYYDLLGFLRFHWPLKGLMWFGDVLLGLTGFSILLLGIYWFDRVFLAVVCSLTGFYWVFHVLIGWWRVWQSFIAVLLGFTG